MRIPAYKLYLYVIIVWLVVRNDAQSPVIFGTWPFSNVKMSQRRWTREWDALDGQVRDKYNIVRFWICKSYSSWLELVLR